MSGNAETSGAGRRAEASAPPIIAVLRTKAYDAVLTSGPRAVGRVTTYSICQLPRRVGVTRRQHNYLGELELLPCARRSVMPVRTSPGCSSAACSVYRSKPPPGSAVDRRSLGFDRANAPDPRPGRLRRRYTMDARATLDPNQPPRERGQYEGNARKVGSSGESRSPFRIDLGYESWELISNDILKVRQRIRAIPTLVWLSHPGAKPPRRHQASLVSSVPLLPLGRR